MHHTLDSDDTYKIYVQYALNKLQSIYGNIPFKVGFGKVSNTIISKIENNTMYIEQSSEQG